MKKSTIRFAAALAVTAAGISQAFALTVVTPVKPVPIGSSSPSLPVLKVCFTQLNTSASTSRLFARVCAPFEAPGTVRLGG